MEVKGLLFKKLDEDFILFLRKKKGKETNNVPDDEKRQIIEEYEDTVIENSLKTLFSSYDTFLNSQVKNQEIISKRIENSFRYFFGYMHAVDQVYESIRSYLNINVQPEKNKYIIPHYGNLIRLADQIGVMLRNGYPDGALRIWRSFYEYVAVTLLLIKENENENLHKKFIDHFNRSKKKKAESLQKHHTDLKFPAFEEDFLLNLKSTADEFNTKYGKDFLGEEYGWAKDLFSFTHKVTLRDIEEYVGIDRFRPFYIWASGYTHPGFDSMIDFFEEEGQKLILGKINRQSLEKRKFIDPLQLTIALFHEVNIEFLKLYSIKVEYEINILMLRKIFESMLKTFDDLAVDE